MACRVGCEYRLGGLELAEQWLEHVRMLLREESLVEKSPAGNAHHLHSPYPTGASWLTAGVSPRRRALIGVIMIVVLHPRKSITRSRSSDIELAPPPPKA